MYVSESSSWRRRRLRRQRLTMAVIVLLVVAVGVGAFGYRSGWFTDPADDVAVSALPPCPAPTATVTAVRPADVHVNVYNSTSRNGLAASVAAELRKRTFAVGTVANDPLHANVTGTALVRFGTAGAEAAKLVQAQVPKATVHRDKRKGADVDLVLGDAFRSLAPVATATTPAPSGPATCTPAATPTSGSTSGSPTSSSPKATSSATS